MNSKLEKLKLQNLLNFKRKYGFTLAEVLITLGIIGVVAAITIPALISNYQKIVFANKLKVFYARITTAQKTIEDEFGSVKSWEFPPYTDKENCILTNREIVRRYVNLLGGTICAEYNNDEYPNVWIAIENKKAYNCGVEYNKVKYLNGKSAKGDHKVMSWVATFFQLKDGTAVNFSFKNNPGGGVLWELSSFEQDNKRPRAARITVDLNGSKPPNTVGKDIFVFGLYKDLNTPISSFSKDTSNCTKDGTGLSCVKKVMDSGWKITYF